MRIHNFLGEHYINVETASFINYFNWNDTQKRQEQDKKWIYVAIIQAINIQTHTYVSGGQLSL